MESAKFDITTGKLECQRLLVTLLDTAELLSVLEIRLHLQHPQNHCQLLANVYPTLEPKLAESMNATFQHLVNYVCSGFTFCSLKLSVVKY